MKWYILEVNLEGTGWLLNSQGNIRFLWFTKPTCTLCKRCDRFWLIVINEIRQISRKKLDFARLTVTRSKISQITGSYMGNWSLLNCVLYVLPCQRASLAYKLTCQRALHAYVLTCQRALRAHLPTCLARLRTHVPYVPTCSRANVSRVLKCSRAKVPCVLTCQLAFHSYVLMR